MSTTVQEKKKYPNLRQLDFNKKYSEDKLEEEIRDMENSFKYLDRDEYPTQWYYLNMQLGELYRRLNLKIRGHPALFKTEVRESLINEK